MYTLLQATLINAILRNYISFNLFTQAEKFRMKITPPEWRSNSEHARFLYYQGAPLSHPCRATALLNNVCVCRSDQHDAAALHGRARAPAGGGRHQRAPHVPSAHVAPSQALRKAPQKGAVGFRQAVSRRERLCGEGTILNRLRRPTSCWSLFSCSSARHPREALSVTPT